MLDCFGLLWKVWCHSCPLKEFSWDRQWTMWKWLCSDVCSHCLTEKCCHTFHTFKQFQTISNIYSHITIPLTHYDTWASHYDFPYLYSSYNNSMSPDQGQALLHREWQLSQALLASRFERFRESLTACVEGSISYSSAATGWKAAQFGERPDPFSQCGVFEYHFLNGWVGSVWSVWIVGSILLVNEDPDDPAWNVLSSAMFSRLTCVDRVLTVLTMDSPLHWTCLAEQFARLMAWEWSGQGA